MEENEVKEKLDCKSDSKDCKHNKRRVFVNKVRENPWILSTIVLGVLFLGFLFGGIGFNGNATGAVSANVAADNFYNFAKAKGIDVTVNGVSEQEGLYLVSFSTDEGDSYIYISKDGKNLISGLVPLTLSNSSSSSQVQQTSGPVDIPIDNSPVLGDADAPLTIVEFSDLSCPFCAAASGASEEMVSYMENKYSGWEPAIPGIIKDYVDTGKAKLVYKYSMGHSGAHPATLVAWCLNEQGLFWEMHDAAFANQNDVEDLEKMKELAETLGADMTKLQSCLDSDKYDSKFDEDQALSSQIGIGGTPAIYANGVKVANGAESYGDVKEKIESILADLQ